MVKNKYDYTVGIFWCIEKHGYYTEQQKLPDWMHIVVTNDNDSKYLTVHSRIHMNKEVRVGQEYSTDYSDNDIIKELSGEIAYRFR